MNCTLKSIAFSVASIALFATGSLAALPPGYTGTVFDSLKGKPMEIPGFVTAAYWDKGADGVTFHYTWTNMGDCYWRNGDPGKAVSLQYFGTDKDFVAKAGTPKADSACYPYHKNCHLGWVQVGEWFKYTVHVNTAGTYKMILHHSVVDTSNLILFNIGDLPTDSVGNLPISIRPTGDHEINHDWKWDTTKTRLTLDTGLYVIKVSFFHEGLNFHGMKFLLDGTSTLPEVNKGPAKTTGLTVMPIIKGNNLNVSYSLTQAGPATLSVYNCVGKQMVASTTGNQKAGTYSRSINMSTFGHGVYFVELKQNGMCQVERIRK